MPELILASSSPRRRAIMTKMGFDFRVITAAVDEEGEADDPQQFTENIALRKARCVAASLKAVTTDGLVIAGDTVVCGAGRVLGKPRDRSDAVRMLELLSGSEHEVVTGVAVICVPDGSELAASASTKVEFRFLSRQEIEAYVDTGEAYGKAGAYAIQGRGSVLVQRKYGSYDNVVGLPSALLLELLRKSGLAVEEMLFRN